MLARHMLVVMTTYLSLVGCIRTVDLEGKRCVQNPCVGDYVCVDGSCVLPQDDNDDDDSADDTVDDDGGISDDAGGQTADNTSDETVTETETGDDTGLPVIDNCRDLDMPGQAVLSDFDNVYGSSPVVCDDDGWMLMFVHDADADPSAWESLESVKNRITTDGPVFEGRYSILGLVLESSLAEWAIGRGSRVFYSLRWPKMTGPLSGARNEWMQRALGFSNDVKELWPSRFDATGHLFGGLYVADDDDNHWLTASMEEGSDVFGIGVRADSDLWGPTIEPLPVGERRVELWAKPGPLCGNDIIEAPFESCEPPFEGRCNGECRLRPNVTGCGDADSEEFGAGFEGVVDLDGEGSIENDVLCGFDDSGGGWTLVFRQWGAEEDDWDDANLDHDIYEDGELKSAHKLLNYSAANPLWVAYSVLLHLDELKTTAEGYTFRLRWPELIVDDKPFEIRWSQTSSPFAELSGGTVAGLAVDGQFNSPSDFVGLHYVGNDGVFLSAGELTDAGHGFVVGASESAIADGHFRVNDQYPRVYAVELWVK